MQKPWNKILLQPDLTKMHGPNFNFVATKAITYCLPPSYWIS